MLNNNVLNLKIMLVILFVFLIIVTQSSKINNSHEKCQNKRLIIAKHIAAIGEKMPF